MLQIASVVICNECAMSTNWKQEKSNFLVFSRYSFFAIYCYEVRCTWTLQKMYVFYFHVSESWQSDPSFIQYLSELSSFGVEKLGRPK